MGPALHSEAASKSAGKKYKVAGMQHSLLQALLPHPDITQGTKRSSSGMSKVGVAHTRADDRKVSESELMVFRSALSA